VPVPEAPPNPQRKRLVAYALLVLGEQIHGYHILGFVLVLAGLVLTSKR
jgi:drug/metabolite transporter (DMT)-like permease